MKGSCPPKLNLGACEQKICEMVTRGARTRGKQRKADLEALTTASGAVPPLSVGESTSILGSSSAAFVNAQKVRQESRFMRERAQCFHRVLHETQLGPVLLAKQKYRSLGFSPSLNDGSQTCRLMDYQRKKHEGIKERAAIHEQKRFAKSQVIEWSDVSHPPMQSRCSLTARSLDQAEQVLQVQEHRPTSSGTINIMGDTSFEEATRAPAPCQFKQHFKMRDILEGEEEILAVANRDPMFYSRRRGSSGSASKLSMQEMARRQQALSALAQGAQLSWDFSMPRNKWHEIVTPLYHERAMREVMMKLNTQSSRS